MGIFDIFKRNEEYKGFKLSPDVDVALQKQLIDRGRGDEINSLTPAGVAAGNKMMNVTADSTPAFIGGGKNQYEPAPVDLKTVAADVKEKIITNPKVVSGLENTVGWLNAVDDTSQGLIKRDDGSVVLTQDLPALQQAAGGLFHTFKNIGRGELATTESTLNGLQWLGVEQAAPLSEKLNQWQSAIAPENPTFADNIASGVGSAVLFFLPGAGVMKASSAIGLYSPRLAALFANSAMTAFEALTEAGDTWKTLKDQGKSTSEADSAATKTFWANAVLIGLTNKLAYFNKVKGLKKLLLSSPMEGIQEFGQQIIQNLSTNNPNVMQGALEAGAIGTIIGGILGGADLGEIGNDAVKTESPDKREVSQVAVPGKFYRLETADGNKYFSSQSEAQSFAEKNNTSGSFLITEQGKAEALKIVQDGSLSAFPFENGISKEQSKINETIASIQSKTGLSQSEAADVFGSLNELIKSENIKDESLDSIFKEAVSKAQIEMGQTPDIIKEALKVANKGLITTAQEEIAATQKQSVINAEQIITTEEARAISKNFPFIEKMNIPLVTKNKILTASGQAAFGRYSKGVIEFIENPQKNTIPHEAVHAYMDIMMSAEQKKSVTDEAKRRFSGKIISAKKTGNYKGLSDDAIAEEILAEDMISYIKTGQASSSKLKKFYDWFISQIKNLLGKDNRDIIANFYTDIQKSPSYQQRAAARKKLTAIEETVDDLRKEYFQNPDALTTKFLENVDVKNRETASYEFLKNLLKSKSLPLKEVERNLIDNILDDQFKNEKKIVLEDLRAAVRGELLPLQVIESSTYSDYGSSQVDMDSEGSGEDFDYTTDIYNSPFNHGYTGHFSGDFTNRFSTTEPESQKGLLNINLRGELLTQIQVGKNTPYEQKMEMAKDWIAKNRPDLAETDKGLFGHARIWKATTDPNSPDYGIRYVAEIQSDAFQNIERVHSRQENVKDIKDRIAEEEKAFAAYREAGANNANMLVAYQEKLKHLSGALKEAEAQQIKPAEENFLKYRNTWFERIIREEIRRGAMEGDKKMRVPTPYTVAKIEGYLSEDGQIPEGTIVGDTFEYAGTEYTLLKDNNDYMGENTGLAVPSSDVRTVVDYDTVRQEDFDSEMGDKIIELKDAKTADEIREVFRGEEAFTPEVIKNIKKLLKADDQSGLEEELTPIIEKMIDSHYTDAAGYAEYWNEGSGEDYSYPTENEEIIILSKNDNVETLGIGAEDKGKIDFNYENDLDGDEQKTVARFYDKQVSRYMSKLRKDNFRTVTDDRGYDWYETDIIPEDKAAVEAFQVNPAEKPLTRTGKEVADYFSEVEAEFNGDEVDEYMTGLIEKQNFSLQSVKIKDLMAQDPDLKKYVEAGENRYSEDNEGTDEDLPIIVGSWNDGSFGVLDGFNRTLTKLENGDEYIEAWVADDKPKYQAMSPSQAANLEYRRNNEQANRSEAEIKKELDIIAARETNLSYSNSEQEAGYQAFKKMAGSRPWLKDSGTDEAMIKQKLPAINIDNLFFPAAVGKSNDEQLENFKDRLEQENILKETAKQKTPSELDAMRTRTAEKSVASATIGRKATLKTAINIVQGRELPITITKKESVLLKNRLRDMARAAKTGAQFGRSEMRADLTLAFAGKLQYQAMIKKAIITYAKDLPGDIRGTMLNAVADASNMSDMVKAFARIDAALKNSDIKDQLQKIKSMAKKVSKAMKTGRGIAVDYQKKIADILNEYNLKNPTAATIEKLNSLSDYIALHPEANIPDHLVKRLDVLKKKSPKELTGESLADLNDLLGRLWSLGELKLAMKGKYDERFIRASVDQLLMTTRNVDNSTLPGLSLLHAPRVADIFDGFRQYKGYNVALQKKINRAVSGSVVTTKNIVTDAAEIIAAVKNEFTREEQAAMAFQMAKDQKLFTQAQSLISAYSDEFGWKSEADIKISPEIKTAIDTMRGAFNTNVDYLAAVYEEIENKPFIKTDNYFPNKYDREFDKHLDIEAPTVGQMADFSSKQISKGFTFARIKGVKKVLRIDVFNVFSEAVAEQQYYMRVQPVINEIANITNDARYQDRLGKIGSQWWDLYLKSVANKGKIPNFGVWKSIDPLLRAVKINISNAVLGYKISSALIQPTAIIDAYAYVYLNHGILAANGLILRLAGTLTLPGYSKSIVKKSIGLQIRTGGELTIREMQEEPARNKLIRGFQKGGMWLLRNMDLLTASAVQKTMYKHFRGQGMAESEAQSEADFVMNLTQGSSEIADLPLILSSGELAKTILTFQTFVLNRWGLIAHDFLRSAILHGTISRKLKGLIALMLISLAGGIENILRTKAQEAISGKKYPSKFNFLQQSLLTAPETIPVFGSIITSVIEYNQGASLPLTRVMESIIQGAKSVVAPAGETKKQQDINKLKGAIKFSEAAATLFGVAGSAQLSDIIQRLVVPIASTKSAGSGNNLSTPALPKLPALPKPPKLPAPPKR